jgi:hypothetical protein
MMRGVGGWRGGQQRQYFDDGSEFDQVGCLMAREREDGREKRGKKRVGDVQIKTFFFHLGACVC